MSAVVQMVILGAGGHGRVVLATLRACASEDAQQRVACIAPLAPKAPWPTEILWLGDDSAFAALDPTQTLLFNGIGSVADTRLRRRVFLEARERGFSLPPLVHASAILERDVVEVGAGTQIMTGAVIQTGVRLGANVLVNTAAVVDHDCQIQDHAHLGPGVTLSGGVVVGEGAHIGTGATVIQGIVIGAHAVVGAGALVISDVPPGACVVGVPAKALSRHESEGSK